MKIEKVFFDMDGVLADFERGVKELCGLASQSPNAKHRSPREDDQMWASIKEVPHFYDRLAPMPGAKELFDTVYGRYGDKWEKMLRSILCCGKKNCGFAPAPPAF